MTAQVLEHNIELAPCPWCDDRPEILHGPNHADVILYWVECVNRKCEMVISTWMDDTPEKAAKIWNRCKA